MHCAPAIAGGVWGHDLGAGPFYASLSNAPSNASTDIGAALSYPRKPSYMSNAVHIAAERSKGRGFTGLSLSSPLGENQLGASTR